MLTDLTTLWRAASLNAMVLGGPGRIRPEAVDAGAAVTLAQFTRVQVLGKVRDILDLFTLQRPVLDLKAIRADSGLPASTCARLVHNMVADGLLTERRGGYQIGLAVIRWAAVARQGLGLVDAATPELRRLRDEVGETTGLFVREGDQRVCVALSESAQIVGRRLTLGHIAPLHANAAGKVILAFDPDARDALRGRELARFTDRTKSQPADLEIDLRGVREIGYALSCGEWHDDVAGVAAPVWDGDRELVASVGVSVPMSRFTAESAEQFGSAVAAAARRISNDLGCSSCGAERRQSAGQ